MTSLYVLFYWSTSERFGTDFTDADQLFFDQIIEAAIEEESLKEAAA